MREVPLVFWAAFALAALRAVAEPVTAPPVLFAVLSFLAAGVVTGHACAGGTASSGSYRSYRSGEREVAFAHTVLIAAMLVGGGLFCWALGSGGGSAQKAMVGALFLFGLAVAGAFAAGAARERREEAAKTERERREAEEARSAEAYRKDAEERQKRERAEQERYELAERRALDEEAFLQKAQALLSQAGSTNRKVVVRGKVNGADMELSSEANALQEQKLRQGEDERRRGEDRERRIEEMRQGEW